MSKGGWNAEEGESGRLPDADADADADAEGEAKPEAEPEPKPDPEEEKAEPLVVPVDDVAARYSAAAVDPSPIAPAVSTAALLSALISATRLTAFPTACLIGLRCPTLVSAASTSMASPPSRGRPSTSHPAAVVAAALSVSGAWADPSGPPPPPPLVPIVVEGRMEGQMCTAIGSSPRDEADIAVRTHRASLRITHAVRGGDQNAQSARRSTKRLGG